MYCIPGTLLGTLHGFLSVIFHATQDFGIIIFKKQLGALRMWL